MNVYILDQDFKTVSVIDTYESIIWTDRYNQCGDFEIYVNFSSEILQSAVQDYYLMTLQSEHMMIIEGLEIDSNSETGNHLRITGRSLESMLDRRIIWSQTSITGSLQNAIKKLINESIISPSIADRRISNFIFEDSTDTRITSLTVEAEYTGDNLYEIITDLCSANNVGFKITLNDNNQFVFKLYMGEDRSYAQDNNPYVVFSPKYENVINTNYIDSTENLRNVALVAGEDASQQRRTLVVGSGTGLLRRELFVDARDIQSDKVTDYNAALRQRGVKYLSENTKVVNFEGEVETTKLFVYGEDFYMGDIIQIVNEYGIQGSARVIEFIYNEDTNGIKKYPTFEAIQDVDTSVS